MNVLELVERAPVQRGYTTLFSIGSGKVRQVTFKKNQIMDGITTCSARLFGGAPNFKAGAMYFEYQNLASEIDDPTPPAFSKDEGVEYYSGLQYSPNVDFIRVPILVAPAVSEREAGTLLTLYAVTPASDYGFWGKPFDALNNSAVYGGAVVATPDVASPSADVVIARNYPTAAKVLKAPGEQICMVWSIEFVKPVSGS